MAKTKSATTKKPRSEPKNRKRTPADNPEQYERFRQFAREHETDEDPEAFERAARKVIPHRPRVPR